MQKCELRNEIVEKIIRCSECGVSFCSDCGDTSKKLCEYCLEDLEYEEMLWEEELEKDWEETWEKE